MFGTNQTERNVFVFVVYTQSLVFTVMSIYCQFIFFVGLTFTSGDFCRVLGNFH